MKKIIFFLFLILSACNQKKAVVEENKFIDILADIHLAEVMTERIDTAIKIQNINYTHFQDEIFLKHGIDSNLFKNSYEYYTKDIIKAQVFYEKVLVKLEEKSMK